MAAPVGHGAWQGPGPPPPTMMDDTERSAMTNVASGLMVQAQHMREMASVLQKTANDILAYLNPPPLAGMQAFTPTVTMGTPDGDTK